MIYHVKVTALFDFGLNYEQTYGPRVPAAFKQVYRTQSADPWTEGVIAG